MKKNFYYIGNTLIELSSTEIIHACINLFLPQTEGNSIAVVPFLKYELIEENSSADVISLYQKYNIRNSSGITFSLLNIQYNYYEKETLYVAGNSFCTGIIDIQNKIVKWHVYLPFSQPRSLFHLTILDPYSLFCPTINELVLHGALISKNQSAMLFIGKSGNGKSTITHKLSKLFGYQKECDDTFILSTKEDILTVHPIDTGCGYDIEISEEYINTGAYYELYRNREKVYIMSTLKPSRFEPIKPTVLFFLERNVCPEEQNTTTLHGLPAEKIFRCLLQNQTNIGNPFLIKKMELYKKMGAGLRGAIISFVNDCDISLIDSYIKEKQ